MIGLLVGKRALWALGGAVALVAGLAAVWWAGGRDARQAGEMERLERERAAWERVRDADLGSGDPANDREWLRERGSRD